MARFQEYDPTTTIEFECDPLGYAETWRRNTEKITPSPWYSEREKAYFDCTRRSISGVSQSRCEMAPKRLLQGKRFVCTAVREHDPSRGYDIVIHSGRDLSIAETKQVRIAKKQILRRIAGVSYRHRAAASRPKLSSLLTFRNRAEIDSFLNINTFVVPLIFEAVGEIKKQFPDSQLLLEVLKDAEGIEPDTLYLYVSTDLSPAVARPKLNTLDNEWWLQALSRAQGKLCISLEYR